MLHGLAKTAVERLVALPPDMIRSATRLFTDDELMDLAEELAASSAAADLLGRTLVRDRGQQVRKKNRLKESLLRESAVPGVNLDVAPVLQQEDWSCGAAVVKAVAIYHGIQLTEAQAAHLLNTTPANGTLPEAIAAGASALGLVVESREDASVEDMAAALAKDAPCICCIHRPDAEEGHWVAVVGVDLDGGTLRIMDPVKGLVTVARAVFESEWWDEAAGHRYERLAIAVGAPPVQESLRLGQLLEHGGLKGFLGAIGGAIGRGATSLAQHALNFFRALIPTRGTDPQRHPPTMARKAFTLAVTTDLEVLKKVQDTIGGFIEKGEPVNTPKAIAAILDDVGITPKNPQYSEAVYRTNVMDAFGESTQQQMVAERETFPIWKYTNPHDSRSRPTHAERDGNYYPVSMTLNDVRGTEAKNVINCRCVQIPVDIFEARELADKGLIPREWLTAA